MLINAGIYEHGKEINPKSDHWEAILLESQKTDRFTWLGLHNATQEEILQIGEKLELHPLIIDDIKSGGQMPKLEEYPNDLFVVCKQARWSPSKGLEEGEVAITVNRHHIASFRTGVGDGFSSVRARAVTEPSLLALGSGYVLYAIMDAIVDRYFPIVKNLEAEFESLEDRVFGEDNAPKDYTYRSSLTRDLYHLRREVVKFRGCVEPMLEVTIKLFGGRVPGICDGLGDYFRDIHDHLMRIVARLDALYDAMGSAVQAQLALTTIEESLITKKLAAWASIFGMNTLWVGLWGMNFKHMPELDWKFGYPMALCIIITSSIVMWRAFHRRGWL